MEEMKDVRQSKKTKASSDSSWLNLAADLGMVAAHGVIFSLAGVAVQRLVGSPAQVKTQRAEQTEDVIHLPNRKAVNA